VKPATYPIADASSNDDLAKNIRRLTFRPDIVIYSGTGSLGARLYNTLNHLGYDRTVFAGAGSIRDSHIADDQKSTSPMYTVDFATTASSKESVNDAKEKYPSVYAACAYDAAGMLLQSILAAQQEDSSLTGYRLYSSADNATSPLPSDFTSTFRKAVTHKLQWINTTNNIVYHGITGTYSFNGSDTDGAPGVTISTYLRDSSGRGEWTAVN
jgi:ABC-type branched-subunit amino acid transport system substrate-binding protein